MQLAGLPAALILIRNVFLSSFREKEEGHKMQFNLELAPVASLVAGVLILIFPKILNYVIAIYLIVVGVLGFVQ